MELDFSQKATPITLEGLRQSIVEKHPNGDAVGGISHINLIESLMDCFEKRGFKPQITDLFAANNRDKYRPGVTIDEYRAAQMQELGYEAIMIRRVFVNVDLGIENYKGSVMKCVISYSQRGIQVAFGPEVTACRNLCILRAKDVFTTYALGRPSLREATCKEAADVLAKVDSYAITLEQENSDMLSMVSQWEEKEFTHLDYCRLLYILLSMRVCKDTEKRELHKNDTYALSNTQINQVHENALLNWIRFGENGRKPSFWDAYNWMNTLYKPMLMESPQIVPQSLALSEAFCKVYNEKQL